MNACHQPVIPAATFLTQQALNSKRLKDRYAMLPQVVFILKIKIFEMVVAIAGSKPKLVLSD